MECQNSPNLQLGLSLLGSTYQVFLFLSYVKVFQIMGKVVVDFLQASYFVLCTTIL